MQQAVKRAWSEELRGHLEQLAAREAQPAPEAENVVRPTFPRREPGAELDVKTRPELAAALSAVMKAADHIRGASERAEKAELQTADLARRAFEQLDQAEAQIEAAHARIREIEEAAAATAQRLGEEIRAADAKARAGAERERGLEQQLVALVQKFERSERNLAESRDQIFAADTRAMEAREDLQYLEKHIREQFGV